MTAIIQATIVPGAGVATENLRHQHRSRWRPPPQRVLVSPDLTAAACALVLIVTLYGVQARNQEPWHHCPFWHSTG